MAGTIIRHERYFQNDFMKMWFEDGIACLEFREDLHINFEIAREMVEKRIGFFEGKAYPIYVDARKLKMADKEARAYMAGEHASKLVVAGAIHVGNSLSSWLGNVFLLLDQPLPKAKLFVSEDEAKAWLRKFLV